MNDPIELVKNRNELVSEMEDKFGYIFCEECQSCKAFKFEVHHIIFRSERPGHEMLHSKINLLVCCSDCHNRFHRNKWSRENLVITRGLDKIFNVNK